MLPTGLKLQRRVWAARAQADPCGRASHNSCSIVCPDDCLYLKDGGDLHSLVAGWGAAVAMEFIWQGDEALPTPALRPRLQRGREVFSLGRQ